PDLAATRSAVARPELTAASAVRSATAPARAVRTAAPPARATPAASRQASSTAATTTGATEPRSPRRARRVSGVVRAVGTLAALGPGPLRGGTVRCSGPAVVGAVPVVIVIVIVGQHPRDGDHLRLLVEVHHPHTGRRAALHRDAVDGGADDDARVVDEDDVVAVVDEQAGDDPTAIRVELVGAHALPAAALPRELLHRGALAVPGVGDGEQVGALAHGTRADHAVALAQLHAAHAGGVAAHRPHVGLREA